MTCNVKVFSANANCKKLGSWALDYCIFPNRLKSAHAAVLTDFSFFLPSSRHTAPFSPHYPDMVILKGLDLDQTDQIQLGLN